MSFFEFSWGFWLSVAGIITLIATALWWFGFIAWWGILIAVPVVTVAVIAALTVIGILAWMAGGSH